MPGANRPRSHPAALKTYTGDSVPGIAPDRRNERLRGAAAPRQLRRHQDVDVGDRPLAHEFDKGGVPADVVAVAHGAVEEDAQKAGGERRGWGAGGLLRVRMDAGAAHQEDSGQYPEGLFSH